MFLVATPHNYSSNMYSHRPSSPLNPNSASSNHPGSSSPLTSPMAGPSHLPSTPSPFSFSAAAPSFPASSSSKRPSPSGTFTTRYTRPIARARHSYPADSPHRGGGGGDLFSTEGATPIEGAMWKERFSRRMEERSRRKAAREEDLRRRRSLSTPGAGSSSPGGMSVEEEEEADRRAQEDDEEIFRRLVILQRRRAEHAALASLERETGGSDPLLPEFWEEEERNIQMEERALISHFEGDGGDHRMSSPLHTPIRAAARGYEREVQTIPEEENEDELWALEAAQAEEAERDAEEAEIARRMEEQYYGHDPAPARTAAMGDEVDWEALDAMAMDID